jgi:hypothetical protein
MTTTDHPSIGSWLQHPSGVHHYRTGVSRRLLWFVELKEGDKGEGTASYRSAQTVGEGRVQCGDAIITDESNRGRLQLRTLPIW